MGMKSVNDIFFDDLINGLGYNNISITRKQVFQAFEIYNDTIDYCYDDGYNIEFDRRLKDAGIPIFIRDFSSCPEGHCLSTAVMVCDIRQEIFNRAVKYGSKLKG